MAEFKHKGARSKSIPASFCPEELLDLNSRSSFGLLSGSRLRKQFLEFGDGPAGGLFGGWIGKRLGGGES